MVYISVVLLSFKEQLLVKQLPLLSQFKGLCAQFKRSLAICFKKENRVFHIQKLYSFTRGRGTGLGSSDTGHRGWLLEDREVLNDRPWPTHVCLPSPPP